MIQNLLTGDEKDLGGFSVRRILPAAAQKSIGPFVFFDHIGPARFPPGSGIDVRPHPHIGLSTVTFLFEGSFLHRDSLGSVQPVQAGDVNWMTAGRGIVHSERTPPDLRAAGSPLHGVQTWLALPRSCEDMAPLMSHHPAATLPRIEAAGCRITVIAGEAFGQASPVPVPTPTLYADVRLAAGATLELPPDHAERAVYVIAGVLEVAGKTLPPATMALLAPAVTVPLQAHADTHLMLVGGAPLDGDRTLWWNFVASDRRRIQEASRHWHAQNTGVFPPVPGETDFIPLPEAAQRALGGGDDDAVVHYP